MAKKGSNDDNTEEKQVTIETEVEKINSPDGGWGWFIVLGCLFLRIIVGECVESTLKTWFLFIKMYVVSKKSEIALVIY